jgi:inner membrane protein involved in colicin E2 resistance
VVDSVVGIYGIKNKVNGKIYIGQSIKIERRWVTHKTELRKNKHPNQYLLNSYNKYGKDNFEFLILEECEKEKLNSMEEKWIDIFSRDNVYNRNFYITDLRGEKNPFFGKKHSIETKKKMSILKKNNNKGELNPNFGKKQSKESRLKMTLGRAKSGLTIENVLEIKQLLLGGVEHKVIAEKFKVGRTVITRISNGTRWTNVTGGPVVPVVYDADGRRRISENHRKNKKRKKEK